ncbi:MAG: DciA family protein [Kocuria sp.]|uniref:DciA family protein n=1 Tax=Kocuria salsicia TaxID=664639 RepID=A0ABV3KDE6_9MICC|nr:MULTISPECIES: DciA family protein [Kocuria]MBS6029559.1 DUF721 domain-containing protein [Kocuria rhizophila]MDO4257210.1 DciA family protein [Kocuria sp.]
MAEPAHRDVVDAAAVALQRVRKAAQGRGDMPLSKAAAAKNMRAFGTAMEEGTGSPALRRSTRFGTDPRQLGGFSGPGKSARDPRPLSSVVDTLMTHRGWKTPVNVSTVLADWPSLVGVRNAEHSWPEHFEDTVVRVRCDSTAYATQLRLMQSAILANFADKLGEGIVTRLEIHGPVGPSWKRGRWRVQGRGPRDTYG